jgi:hypothetical protein
MKLLTIAEVLDTWVIVVLAREDFAGSAVDRVIGQRMRVRIIAATERVTKKMRLVCSTCCARCIDRQKSLPKA